ncbi:AraC family transcriptional regulator [Inquilinus limosus]|uniref:helix-turn-helix domain-containing protein n=1 Tax=Inquilinus limosus TaxID=171674 RepID=UPI003F16C975
MDRPRQTAGDPMDASEAGGGPQPGPSLQRTAFELCAGVIAGPLPIATEIPERDTLITTRWLHLEMHEPMPGLPVHTIGTYYGPPSPRVWRRGRMRLAGVGRPGTIAIVPADWDGDWDIDVASPLSYAMLSDARLQAFAAPLTRGRRIELAPRLGEPDPVGAHILRALSREATHPDPSRRLFVEQALDLLCTHLLRTHSTLGQAPAPLPRRGLPQWQVRRVTAYMSERLDQTIGLDELAALTSLSRSHFCTAFRHATGRTPHEWLTGLRVEQARQLLRDPRIRITDIALAVGYQTPSAFTAAFRRETGSTPSEYRRGL